MGLLKSCSRSERQHDMQAATEMSCIIRLPDSRLHTCVCLCACYAGSPVTDMHFLLPCGALTSCYKKRKDINSGQSWKLLRMIHATLQASLTQARPPPAQWSQIAQSAAQREQQEQQALVVATPGLQNQIGEYNCFLNVVIQCLWHCTVFKARFSALAQGSLATVQVGSWSCFQQSLASSLMHHCDICRVKVDSGAQPNRVQW